MPLKLCHCDKVKLNRVLDQVKTLSTTVDELREEIDLLKPCFADQSSDDETLLNSDSFEKRDNNIGAIRRLKKCLERNVSPIICRDTRYRVKKRCQQFFSQSPQTVPCSARLSSQESSLRRQRCDSPLATRRNYRKNVSCQTAEYRVKQTSKPSARKTSNSTKKCEKNVCIKPTKFATLSTTSSTDSSRSSSSSIPKKSCCSSQCRRKREKITEPATSTSKKCWWKKEENCEIIPSRCTRILPCVNYVGKKKYVAAVTEDSSTSSCILTSKTSIDHPPIYKTHFRQSKKTSNDKDKTKNNAKEEKLVVPQCSPDCLYAKASKLSPKNISTNTIIENLPNDEIYENNHRTKLLECQETQTFIKSHEIRDISFDAYENARKWLCEQSSISLTSCSPRIINNFSLKVNHFESEKSPTADHEKITFTEMERVSDSTEKIHLFEQAKMDSTDWNEKKPTEISIELQSDEEFTNSRLKRTYIISPAILSTKTDGKVSQDSNEQHEDLFSITACLKLDETISRSNCRCGLEVTMR